MCGICGIANADPLETVDRSTLTRMRDIMSYRGPDDAGLLIDGPIGLGFRRLSIIDLATGQQPMANEDGSLQIIFNGEIYNYLELRKAYLEGKHRFSTTSDTEVILHLYEEFGEDCVRYLNGMFAFAIWDARSHRLFLARDRLGVKPLYYTVRNGTLLFASEIKSILQHEKAAVEVSGEGLDDFITFGYVQSPRTLFSGIERLPPGHTLVWREGRVSIRRYWDLQFAPDESLPETECGERLLELLGDSIRLRIRSDVPLGVLLSGGVDSSTIVGLLSRSVGQIKTFSIGYDSGPDYNELDVARVVAARFGTDHHAMILNTSSFRDFISRFVYHMDEPVSDGSAIPLYFVSELASRHVKVVLSGDGADELFAGYAIYRKMLLMERYRQLPDLVRKTLLNPLLRRLVPLPKMNKYLHLSTLALERRYLNVHLYDIRLREHLYHHEFRRALNGYDPLDSIEEIYRQTDGWDTLSRLLYLDIRTWLADDILIKSDRMSMAASIEMREPYLDYRLVEFAARIPSAYKLHFGTSKHILKKSIGDLLPREILQRRKMGFPTPLARLLQKELHAYLVEVLRAPRSRCRGYFDVRFIDRLIEQHLRGEADHHAILWRLLILEEWHRNFVDNSQQAPVTVGR
jgi:asparagine synthase (glutamine-hydrolysing)